MYQTQFLVVCTPYSAGRRSFSRSRVQGTTEARVYTAAHVPVLAALRVAALCVLEITRSSK